MLNMVANPGGEVFDPWRLPGIQQRYSYRVVFYPYSDSLVNTDDTSSTTESPISSHSRRGTSCQGDERRSEPTSPVVETPSPQLLSPTRIHPRGSNASDVSAMPLTSLSFTQRQTLTPSRPSDQRRPVVMPLGPSPRQRLVPMSSNPPLRHHPEPSRPSDQRRPVSTPLGPSPRQRPASTSSNSSPYQYLEPSIAISPRNQQNLSISQRPDQLLGWTHLEMASNRYQAHPLSEELPVPLSAHQHDVPVHRPTTSIPPPLGRPSGGRDLDPRLTAITPQDSRLTTHRTFQQMFISG